VKLFLLGLAFIGFGFWDIYDGRSSFFLIGRWWMWPSFDRDEHPRLFWVCVSLDFAVAILCFGGAVGLIR
jgi:hypothetical protein